MIRPRWLLHVNFVLLTHADRVCCGGSGHGGTRTFFSPLKQSKVEDSLGIGVRNVSGSCRVVLYLLWYVVFVWNARLH